jgi:signal transduction histidine kinase/CheY-like chemotaxis protein
MDRQSEEAYRKRIAELEKALKKATSESEDANRKKTMFLANMSHEIRTPMNSILGMYNLMNQTDLSKEQKEFLEIIHIASQNLLTIINDILDLSKIETGELKLEKKPFSIAEEINHVVKLLSLKAKGRGLDLYSNMDVQIPQCVVGDSVRVKQILINLANNAIKYTSKGEVEIAAEVLATDKHQAQPNNTFFPDDLDPVQIQSNTVVIKFSVRDTGIGISTENQQRLFKAFTQLDDPLKQEFEGTGLGLSISKNLTHIMKGKMGVISQLNVGTSFWFSLAFPVCKTTQTKDNTELQASHKTEKKLKILLVEDNLLNQKFATTTLKREGHQIDIAGNGKIATEMFEPGKYDVILMDIAMPVMDGLEASKRIRTEELAKLKTLNQDEAEKFKSVCIIGITAHVMVTDKEKCLKAGMNDFLAKPYRPNDLLGVIAQSFQK